MYILVVSLMWVCVEASHLCLRHLLDRNAPVYSIGFFFFNLENEKVNFDVAREYKEGQEVK